MVVPTRTQDGVAGSFVCKYFGTRFNVGRHDAKNVIFILRCNDKYPGPASALLLFWVALSQNKDGALVLVLVFHEAQVYPLAFLVFGPNLGVHVTAVNFDFPSKLASILRVTLL